MIPGSQPLKINFLSPPPNLSGGERVIAIYARELVRLGHSVHISCFSPYRPSLAQKIKSLLRARGCPKAEVVGASHYANYGVPYHIANHNKPLTNADLPDADVVIATYWITATWLANLKPCKGSHVYLIQGDEGTIHSYADADRTYSLHCKHIYVSNWIADRIRQRHPSVDGIVIPNAVEIDLFDRGERRQPHRLRIGTMWSGDPIKGADVAIEAIRIARARGIPLEFVAFGNSAPPDEFRSEMDEFLLQPEPSTMADLYASCTAWLFTSRFEGFGLPILEAMAARTPVIGTPTGAAPELIGEGGGIMVPMDDSTAIAVAIVTLHEMDTDSWSSMSSTAFRTAKKHQWDQATQRLVNFLVIQ